MSHKIKITIPSPKGDQVFFVGKKTVTLTLATLLLSPVIAGVSVYQKIQKETEAQTSFAQIMTQLEEKELDIESKRNDLIEKSVSLSRLNQEVELLKSTNKSLNQEIEAKNSQLLILNKRIYDVENVLGISEVEPENTNLQLEERLDTAAVNSAVRATMFRLIPNDSPMDYKRVSSSFGRRLNPISGKRHFHTGIDLACNRGEPIYAPADGVVETVRPSKKGFGNFLVIRHSFGFSSSYAHLKSFKVKSGQFVTKGEKVALCGNSGHSTGSHLHYEVRFLGRYLNPKSMMEWTPENFDPLFEKEKKVNWASLVDLIDNVVRLQVNLTNKPYIDNSIETASSNETESSTSKDKEQTDTKKL